jgi:hypothetical protein
MEPFIKKGKKRNRKADASEDQPAQGTENHRSLDYNSSYRDEEELIDYEPESPPKMSEEEDELYSEYDQIPAHGDEPASNTPTTTDFSAFLVDDSNVRGRRHSQNVFERGRQPVPSTTAPKTPDRLRKIKVCSPLMLVTMWMLRAIQRPRRGRGGVRQSRGIRLAPPKSAGMPEERRTRKELNTYIHQVMWLMWVIAQLVLAALPIEGRKSHTSGSNTAVVGSAAGVGRPSGGRKSDTSGSIPGVFDSAADVGRPPDRGP